MFLTHWMCLPGLIACFVVAYGIALLRGPKGGGPRTAEFAANARNKAISMVNFFV